MTATPELLTREDITCDNCEGVGYHVADKRPHLFNIEARIRCGRCGGTGIDERELSLEERVANIENRLNQESEESGEG